MSFREAEHAGWTARADSYDAAWAAVTGQAIPHILAALGDSFDCRSLLDVCCGPGHLSAEAAARGHRAEGIDFAPTMVALARRNYPAVSCREADAECLPYPDACFDAIACAFGLMHLESPDLAAPRISNSPSVLRRRDAACASRLGSRPCSVSASPKGEARSPLRGRPSKSASRFLIPLSNSARPMQERAEVDRQR